MPAATPIAIIHDGISDALQTIAGQWLSEGRFDCEEIIAPVVPFDESPQAYEEMDLNPENERQARRSI